MRKVFSGEEYKRLKEYIVTNSVQPNADRCCVFLTEQFDVTICFNDATMTACICDLDYTLIDSLEVGEDIFDYLLRISEGVEIDTKKLDFYGRIEDSSECCEYNR